MKKRKIAFILPLFLIFFSLIFITNVKVAADPGPSSIMYSGQYVGNASIMYLSDDMNSSSIFAGNQTSHFLSYNYTNPQGYEFAANHLIVRGYQLINGSGSQVIANNITSQKNLSNVLRVAQDFNVSELCSITRFNVYINDTFPSLKSDNYILRGTIMEDDLTTHVDEGESWIGSGTIDGWINMWFWSNVLEPSKNYSFILELDTWGDTQINYTGNHSWKAELYNNSIYNKGRTLINNGTGWNPIPNDDTMDMLCYYDYDIVIDPEAIDLLLYIDNESCPYLKRESQGWSGYEITYSKYYPIPPNQSINVTCTTNTTIPTLQLDSRLQYFYLIPAIGQFNATSTKIDWTMTYPYRFIQTMVMFFFDKMFAFEQDWDLVEFRDPSNGEMTDYFFGPTTYHNHSYYGAILSMFGIPLEVGDYTGRFTSPNYCQIINPKVKIGSTLRAASYFELGQTIKCEALIQDASNNPISGGNATINITSSTGALIYSDQNLTAANGIVTTPELRLGLNLPTGYYTVSVFWTNGIEVGFYIYRIEVRQQTTLLPFFILMGALIGVAAVSTPLTLYVRRKLQTRHWEKKLQNLFILAKDGRSIYAHSFGIEIQDPALVSAALQAITAFVADAVKSKKELRVIDLQDKKVILGHGDLTMVALISEKDFPIIHKRVEQFHRTFERRYHLQLKSWDGDLRVFKGADKIILDHFPVSMEERITRGVKLKLLEFRERLETTTDPTILIEIMKELNTLIVQYQQIIQLHYMKEYLQLVTLVEEKIIQEA